MTRHSVRWHPFHEMDRMFGDAFARHFANDEGFSYLPIDVYTTEGELVITASLPGVSPEDVEVTFEAGVLTIKGDLPAPLGNVDYLRQERPSGSFRRTIDVNIPVDAAKIEATFDRGVLHIALPKAEKAKPRKVEIKAA
jgi:HSP20 family protein